MITPVLTDDFNCFADTTDFDTQGSTDQGNTIYEALAQYLMGDKKKKK